MVDRHIEEASGAKDAAGRFRVQPGCSTLRPAPAPPVGISMRNVEASVRQASAKRPRGEADAAATAVRLRDAAAEPAHAHAWLRPGLVVKHGPSRAKLVVARLLPGGGRRAECDPLAGGPRAEHAEADLETVLPKPGGRVVVVGSHPLAGSFGVMDGIDEAAYTALVRLRGGARDGLQVEVEYEKVCKTEQQAWD